MAMWNSKGEKVSTAEENRTLVSNSFSKLGAVVQKAVKAKDAYRARLVELDSDLNKATYTAEHLVGLKENAKQDLQAKKAALHAEFTAQLEELQNALTQAHFLFALDNPALTNALKMIEMGGADLGTETIERINAQFAHDQPALQALQQIYKARGVPHDGGLDRQVYNLNDAISSIGQFGEFSLRGEGSINYLAGAIGKVAKLEGIEFDSLPDPVAVGEAAARGAGLSK